MLSIAKYFTRSLFIILILITSGTIRIIAGNIASDTIPLSNTYSGYRIELIDFKMINKTNDKIRGTVTVINSGKYPVALGSFGFKTAKLKVLFDTDLDQKIKEAIVTHVVNTELSLDPGEMRSSIVIDADLVNYKSEWKSNSNANTDKAPAKQTSPVIKSEDKRTVAPEKEKAAPVVDMPVVESSTSTNSSDKCPDLIISRISVVKKTKSHLLLEYTLTNQGTDVAQLYDKTAKVKEYVAIAAYFSASGKLSRGSIIVGGDVIEKGLDETGGQLLPGNSFTHKIDIDLSSKSRYLNNLILSADSRQVIYECIENNNNNSIIID